MIGIEHFVILSAAVFVIGGVGFLVRRNVLVTLMSIEVMLNGVNLALVTFAQQTATAGGAVLVLLVFVAATAVTVIGRAVMATVPPTCDVKV